MNYNCCYINFIIKILQLTAVKAHLHNTYPPSTSTTSWISIIGDQQFTVLTHTVIITSLKGQYRCISNHFHFHCIHISESSVFSSNYIHCKSNSTLLFISCLSRILQVYGYPELSFRLLSTQSPCYRCKKSVVFFVVMNLWLCYTDVKWSKL